MGLRQAFNTNSLDEIAKVLNKSYINSDYHRARQDEALRRKQLFKGNVAQHVSEVIDRTFDDSQNRYDYKQVIDYGTFNNILKRIIRERATVYQKPATRFVLNDTNDRYQSLISETRHDEVMRMMSEALVLQNDVYLGFRVRLEDTPRGPVKTCLTEFVHPDKFWAVADPSDPVWLRAMVFDRKMDGADLDAPRYFVVDDQIMFSLSGKGFLVANSVIEHPFRRIPGLLAHSSPRMESLLDPVEGRDLVAAALAVYLVDVLGVREVGNLLKQVVWAGDPTMTPTGQQQSSRADVLASEGTTVQTYDRGIDLGNYIQYGSFVQEKVAGNYGIAPDVLSQKGAASGLELRLRRVPLEEQRQQQIMVMRPIEKEFAELQKTVLDHDAAEKSFDLDGWNIRYSEVDRFLSERERLDLRATKRRMGLSNVFSEAMEDNPDWNRDQAEKFVMDNIDDQAVFVQLARALNMPQDADVNNPGQSPQANGALNSGEETTDE